MNDQDRNDIVRALEHMIATGCRTADCVTQCRDLIKLVWYSRTNPLEVRAARPRNRGDGTIG